MDSSTVQHSNTKAFDLEQKLDDSDSPWVFLPYWASHEAVGGAVF